MRDYHRYPQLIKMQEIIDRSAALAFAPEINFLLHSFEPFVSLLELLLHQPQFVYNIVELHPGLSQPVLVNLPVLTKRLQHSVFRLGEA